MTRPYRNIYSDAKLLQGAYGEWASGLIKQGYTAYLMTFMFNEVGNMKRDTMIELMFRDMDVYYGKLIRYFTRKPHRQEEEHMRPIFFASPDMPVAKRAKSEPSDAVVNDGLHCHAICLTPPVSRFKWKFDDWAQSHQTFRIKHTSIQRLHVEIISETPERAVQYALKAYGKRVSLDSLLVLPHQLGTTRLRGTDRGYDEACNTIGGSSLMRTRRFDNARL